MPKDKVAVVIPVYRDLTMHENISFTQCTKVLKNYSIILIKPFTYPLSNYLQSYQYINFSDSYFKDVSGYNKLMLSENFYNAFLNYEYILIAQLDSFVFKDELSLWCDKGYDYIGAPWLHRKEYGNSFKTRMAKIRSYVHTKLNLRQKADKLPTLRQFENKVGNGGFSLRRVKKFKDLCGLFFEVINKYNQFQEHHFHEDVFWSIEVNRRKRILNIPSMKEALSFSFENFPERAYKLNDNKLPFGCHAWDKNFDFWKPFIEEAGYQLD